MICFRFNEWPCSTTDTLPLPEESASCLAILSKFGFASACSCSKTMGQTHHESGSTAATVQNKLTVPHTKFCSDAVLTVLSSCARGSDMVVTCL